MKGGLIWLLSLAAAGGLFLALAVISQPGTPEGVQLDAPIPVVIKTTKQPIAFWETVWQGVLQASREYGLPVERHGPPYEKDIDIQLQIVDDIIRTRPPLIILAATDFNRLSAPVERAASMGIPVVTLDSGVSSDKPVSFVATDNIAAGRKAGAEMARLLQADITRAPGQRQVAIVSHIQHTATAIEREAGAREALAGIEIAGTWFCDVDQDKARRIALDLLDRPEIAGLVALNETTTLGVAEAVAGKRASDRVIVVGFDAAIQEMTYLEQGILKATVVQRPFVMGYMSVKTAYDHLRGVSVPAVIDTGSLLVTVENMFGREYQETLFPFGE